VVVSGGCCGQLSLGDLVLDAAEKFTLFSLIDVERSYLLSVAIRPCVSTEVLAMDGLIRRVRRTDERTMRNSVGRRCY